MSNSNAGRLVESIIGCQTYHDYIIIIKDMAERHEPVLMSRITKLRKLYQNRILLQTTQCGLPENEAREIVDRFLTVVDIPTLEGNAWIDDTTETSKHRGDLFPQHLIKEEK